MTRSRTAWTRLVSVAIAVAIIGGVLGVTFLGTPGFADLGDAPDVANGSVSDATTSASSASSATSGGGSGSVAAQAVDADRVAIRIDVAESGTASWELEYRVRLDTDDREAAFENLSADLAANESAYTDRFETRMAATAAAAENATDRSMSIGDVTVETDRRELPESYGVLRYSFEWNGFASVSEDRIVVGDAIAGLFLDSGHRLTIAWPDGYEADVTRPTPDQADATSATWIGPIEFAADEPRVVMVPSSSVGIGGLAVGAALVLLLVLLAGIVYRRRDRLAGLFPAGRSGDDTANDTHDDTTDDVASDTHDDTTDDDAADVAATESGTTSAAEGASGSTDVDDADDADGATADDPSEELLSNEERVLKRLRENGGRMKQQDLVSALGWSDARTSQVVSGLREEGSLESFRLGRENVLRLPEADALDPGDVDPGTETTDDAAGSSGDE
ncbi:hypothetical protein SAMN05192561_103270 [Halopenitus malekzadehii]|uniref:IclR helix-turn-helix domain-containing protein n=1 Tax=Halopenitus malekzadehii TaxID=1267564 RepID=A0A1H6IM97_9EURY|nr:hypothetical protein [Halopenitus malekzadehii]SEH50750.1 hypothetical protein SAMN05192561_103270 [Halopenitus malekzadehii]